MSDSLIATPAAEAAGREKSRGAGASPLVSLKGVGKTFPNGVTALADFDLEVRQGETLTLLGPSGCGKSTVLRLIAGLTEPTAGDISWANEAARQNIGFVFQDPTLLPWASVFDNVFLPLRLAGERRAEAQGVVMEALERVGLADFAKALPRELSGGMKMRCAIARAFITRPALVLMDEPFAALDEVTRCKLNEGLVAIKERLGATIVFVTHSIFESAFVSTRMVVMSRPRGAIVAEIDVDPLLARNEDYRMSESFSTTARRASHALHDAMGDAP